MSNSNKLLIEDTRFLVIITKDAELLDGKCYPFYLFVDDYMETLKFPYCNVIELVDAEEGA